MRDDAGYYRFCDLVLQGGIRKTFSCRETAPEATDTLSHLASVRHTTLSMTNTTDRVEIITGSAPSALDCILEGSDGWSDLRARHDSELRSAPERCCANQWLAWRYATGSTEDSR
jgi:hypothetical protein